MIWIRLLPVIRVLHESQSINLKKQCKADSLGKLNVSAVCCLTYGALPLLTGYIYLKGIRTGCGKYPLGIDKVGLGGI